MERCGITGLASTGNLTNTSCVPVSSISHCTHRKSPLPILSYNLFWTMLRQVESHTVDQVNEKLICPPRFELLKGKNSPNPNKPNPKSIQENYKDSSSKCVTIITSSGKFKSLLKPLIDLQPNMCVDDNKPRHA